MADPETRENATRIVTAGAGPSPVAPPASINLELLDIPECILQHISTFVPTQQWARRMTWTCRKLNALSLPVMKVGHEKLAWRRSRSPQLFAWMGKRIANISHLEITIDCRENSRLEKLLHHLHSSGHELSANMETVVLTWTCHCQCQSRCRWWTFEGYDCRNPAGAIMAKLQGFVTKSCPKLRTMSLSLGKAPSWRVHGPSLRHMCLHVPSSTAIVASQWPEEPPCAKSMYKFKKMSGMHSRNLPNLQTLFIQGLREPVEVRGVNFQDSNTLEVIDVHDCWIADLSVPLFCKICVSAQSSFCIGHLDGSRGHPLVSRATHVCLPTDLGDCIKVDDNSGHLHEHHTGRLHGKYAMGIPDMFPAMRSLRMTGPKEDVRYMGYNNYEKVLRCFSNHAVEESGYAGMALYHMKGLSRRWQHTNLRELIIEGKSLGVTIPALPNLETLLVSCKENVALDFVDAYSLGRTITRMGVIGTAIHFRTQQQQELCTALEARGLRLGGDCERCIAIHQSNGLAPHVDVLHQQAVQGLACQCKACPTCLGIGQT